MGQQIKPDPDAATTDYLLSRDVLSRGFPSFDSGADSVLEDLDLLNVSDVGGPDGVKKRMMKKKNQLEFDRNAEQFMRNKNDVEIIMPYKNLVVNKGMMMPPNEPRATSASTPHSVKRGASSSSYAQRLLGPEAPTYLSTPMSGSSLESSCLSLGDHNSGIFTGASHKTLSFGMQNGARSLDSKQHLMAEKKRRRRESHNAVERRRRDNINEKINELSELLPEHYITISGQPALRGTPKDDNRPHKGTILALSVGYIKKLQLVIDEQNQKELEHQQTINELQGQLGVSPTEFTYTTAEQALSRLGLRPIEESPEERDLDEETNRSFLSESTKITPNESALDFVTDNNSNDGENSAYCGYFKNAEYEFDEPFNQE